jgi:hypothetical protein
MDRHPAQLMAEAMQLKRSCTAYALDRDSVWTICVWRLPILYNHS